jgi:hypothetical protein
MRAIAMLTEQSGSDGSKLEARVTVLEELFIRLAQAGATESILGHGFECVSERLDNIANQLAPLRALGPEVPKLTADQTGRLQKLVDALVSPDPKVKPTPPAEQSAASVQMRSAS